MRARLEQITFPGSGTLRAFESAGRLGSFKRAALELKVTESAISHQIRKLESDLGTELFDRGHRQVKLTPAGRAYLLTVQKAHRDILNATMSLEGTARQQVRLSLLPALAQFWLVPQLGQLRKKLPDVSLSVFITSDLVDLDRDEIDLAIRYGTGTWPRCRAQHLFDEWIFPVAAPEIARRVVNGKGPVSSIPRLQNLQHPDEWTPWIQDWGSAEVIRLESSPLVMEAARNGLGVAIGRRPFVDRLLSEGQLVPLGGDEQPSGMAHFILTPSGKAGDKPTIRACVDALLELAQREPVTAARNRKPRAG